MRDDMEQNDGMEQNTGVSGYDLCLQIEEVMRLAVRQAMIAHSVRKGCEWEKDAYEDITKSPVFKATVDTLKLLPSFKKLCKLLEFYEKCKEAA